MSDFPLVVSGFPKAIVDLFCSVFGTLDRSTFPATNGRHVGLQDGAGGKTLSHVGSFLPAASSQHPHHEEDQMSFHRNRCSLVVAFITMAETISPLAHADGTAQASTSTGAISIASSGAASPWFGGSGGGTWGISCNEIHGLLGRSGSYIDQLGVRCSDGSSTPVGGSGGGPFALSCPTGYYAAGIYGSAGAYVDSLGLFCRSDTGRLRMTASVGGTGGGYFEYECPSGMFLTAFNVRKGGYIDAIQALCVRF